MCLVAYLKCWQRNVTHITLSYLTSTSVLSRNRHLGNCGLNSPVWIQSSDKKPAHYLVYKHSNLACKCTSRVFALITPLNKNHMALYNVFMYLTCYRKWETFSYTSEHQFAFCVPFCHCKTFLHYACPQLNPVRSVCDILPVSPAVKFTALPPHPSISIFLTGWPTGIHLNSLSQFNCVW